MNSKKLQEKVKEIAFFTIINGLDALVDDLVSFSDAVEILNEHMGAY